MNNHIKTRPAVSKLRKELAGLLREIRATRRKPRPDPVLEGFREGFRPPP